MKKISIIIGCLFLLAGPVWVLAKEKRMLSLVYYQSSFSGLCLEAYAEPCPGIGFPDCFRDLFGDENGTVLLGLNAQIYADRLDIFSCSQPYYDF